MSASSFQLIIILLCVRCIAMQDGVAFTGNEENRLAIVITIAGPTKLSDYFIWSCRSIESSMKLFDMVVLHEGNSKIMNGLNCAPNVIFVDLGERGMAKRIVEKIMNAPDTRNSTVADMIEIVDRVLMHIPRYLVEIKPMLGDLFQEYLTIYSHWTYSDPDIIWGDLPYFIEEKDLNYYDIITLAKSLDAGRLFLRGQFSLHKNNPIINQLWKYLNYLKPIEFARRMGNAVHMISNNVNSQYTSEHIFSKNFYSAEGEYSKIVFNQPSIKLKIIGRGFDDFSMLPIIRSPNGSMYRCVASCESSTTISIRKCLKQCLLDLDVEVNINNNNNFKQSNSFNTNIYLNISNRVKVNASNTLDVSEEVDPDASRPSWPAPKV